MPKSYGQIHALIHSRVNEILQKRCLKGVITLASGSQTFSHRDPLFRMTLLRTKSSDVISLGMIWLEVIPSIYDTQAHSCCYFEKLGIQTFLLRRQGTYMQPAPFGHSQRLGHGTHTQLTAPLGMAHTCSKPTLGTAHTCGKPTPGTAHTCSKLPPGTEHTRSQPPQA